MLKVNFEAYSSYVTDSIYQWELNRTLKITGLDILTTPEVHFSNSIMGKAIVEQCDINNGVITVNIPNSILQHPLRIDAHVGIYEGKEFKVIEKIEIPVIPRERPEDYFIEDADEEIYSFKELENKIANSISEFDRKVIANNTVLNARLDNVMSGQSNSMNGYKIVTHYMVLPYQSFSEGADYYVPFMEFNDPIWKNAKEIHILDARANYGVADSDDTIEQIKGYSYDDFIGIQIDNTSEDENHNDWVIIIDGWEQRSETKPEHYAVAKVTVAYSEDTDLTELKDIRVGADGNTYDSAGTAIREQFNDLSKNKYVKSILFDRNIYTTENGVIGKAIHGDTGELTDNENYFTTDYIEVNSNTIMYSNFFDYSTVALYDKDKTFISRLDWDVKEWNTNGAKFIRVTCIKTNKDALYVGYAPYDGLEYDESFKREIKEIVSEKEVLNKAVICFIDDDANALFMSKTKPVYDSFNIKVGIGVITNTVGNNNYMTVDQLLSLQTAGYEIMSHSATHSDLYNQDLELFDNLDSVYEEDMNASLNFLLKNGLNVNTFVYPRGWFHGGKYENMMIRNTAKFYNYAIDNGNDYETTTDVNPFMIKRIFIRDEKGLDYYKNLIDEVKNNPNALLVFGVHSGMDEVTPEFLTSVINYIVNSGVAIMKPCDAFNAKIVK